MTINGLIMFQLLAFFLAEGIILKIVIISFMVLFLFKKKLEIESKKEKLINLIYGIPILILNCFITLDLNVLNFMYLCVFSYFVYIGRINIKIENYSSLYLLLVLLEGVSILW